MTLDTSNLLPGLLAFIAITIATGCASNPQYSTGGGLVKGSVAYRERMALPPDALVKVQLLDVSLQDVSAQVISETTITAEGRQVPLPFELRYSPEKIQPNRTYAVRATIHFNGRMMFTTDKAYHVITRGNPNETSLMLVRVQSAEKRDTGDLQGTSWRLEDLGGTGVLDRVQATLEFSESGRVSGNGSCNQFSGTVKISGESITFGPLAATRKACVDAVGMQENNYFKALGAARRFNLDGPFLLIYSEGADKPLRFIRTSPGT